MNRLLVLSLCCLLLAAMVRGVFMPAPPAWAQERGRLVLACTPWKAPEVLREVHEPLLRYLAEELGLEVVFHVAQDYEELAQRLEARAVDLGMFSPNAYVQARQRLPGLQYLASIRKKNTFGDVIDHFRGYIVTRSDSSIRTLRDLEGKRFGFTDPQSTSGYLYPRLLLQKEDIEPETFFSRIFMLKKHDKVLMAVLEGSVDAGACYDDAFHEMDFQHPGMLRVIAQTPEIPFDAYAAGEHVGAEMVQALQQALLGYENYAGRTPEVLGSPHSFVVRGDDFYDVVREANEKLR